MDRQKPPHYDETYVPWTAILAVLNSKDSNLTRKRLEKELNALDRRPDENIREYTRRIQGR